MKKFFTDFASFLKRGNILDLAIGIIIGTAFNKIVSSLVNDILMPLISGVIGVNVSHLYLELVPESIDAKAVVLSYGNFLQTILDFLIIAFSIFMAVRLVSRIRRRAAKLANMLDRSPEETTVLVEEVAPVTELSVLLDIKNMLMEREANKEHTTEE